MQIALLGKRIASTHGRAENANSEDWQLLAYREERDRRPLLELAAFAKLANETGHRIGMNAQELGCPTLMPLRRA
jgi:hypothetical protein